MTDAINPDHYKSRSVECITFTRQMGFCLGNAFKYAWRLGMKDEEKQEKQKIVWYLNDYLRECTPCSSTEDTQLLIALLLSMKQELEIDTYHLLHYILLANNGCNHYIQLHVQHKLGED